MQLLSAEARLRLYSTVRGFESGALAFDSLASNIKRSYLHGGEAAVADLVAMSVELDRQLREMETLSRDLATHLGVLRRGAKPIEAPSEVKDRIGMRGTTDAFAVPDLVNTLSNLGKTGTLSLYADEVVFVFEFEAGKIVHAVTNKPDSGLRLGSILLAQNKLSAYALQASIEASRQANELLGEHLVTSATVSESDLREALNEQVRRISDAAFALVGARFSFAEGDLSCVERRTAVNTIELLLEAARQLDHQRRDAGEAVTTTAQDAVESILGGD